MHISRRNDICTHIWLQCTNNDVLLINQYIAVHTFVLYWLPVRWVILLKNTATPILDTPSKNSQSIKRWKQWWHHTNSLSILFDLLDKEHLILNWHLTLMISKWQRLVVVSGYVPSLNVISLYSILLPYVLS